MKYEWRKKDKAIYLPKKVPEKFVVPTMQYLTVHGEGNPNGDVFAQCVEALYAMSYGIKMYPKGGGVIEGYYDYTVFPLEAKWSLTEAGIERYKTGADIVDLKDYFSFKVMIRQPDFVQGNLVEEVRVKTMTKKSNNMIKAVTFETIDEGLSVQMMHIGSYDDEPASFDTMEAYAKSQGLSRIGKVHKEIYLSDPRRVAVDKLKTTLRFWVE